MLLNELMIPDLYSTVKFPYFLGYYTAGGYPALQLKRTIFDNSDISPLLILNQVTRKSLYKRN